MGNPKKWAYLLDMAENVLWKLNRNETDSDFETSGKTHPALIDRNDVTIRMLQAAVDSLKSDRD